MEVLAVLICVPACGPGGVGLTASEDEAGATGEDESASGEDEGTTAPGELCPEGGGELIYDESGQETGFVRCPDGRVNRVAAVSCGPGGTCETDADCGPDQMCLCPEGELFEIQDLWSTPGTCHPAGCLDGSDCASGECGLAPTDDFGCGSEPALACRSDQDMCAVVETCTDSTACGIVNDSFQCTWFGCAGRPLLDADQSPIFAASVAREDWHCELGQVGEALVSAELRGQLSAYWERCALGEHASVASFARFAHDLLALGAPAELLRRTAMAMADEVEHARLCFGLARRFGTGPGHAGRGPGPLPLGSVSRKRGRREVLASLIAEACIGETLAVAEAAAALEACSDPAVASVLRTIVDDETSHAALAWASLRWAVSTADHAEKRWIGETLRRAVDGHRAANACELDTASDGDLREWGCLASAELAQARAQALTEVIEPAVALLLPEQETSRPSMTQS